MDYLLYVLLCIFTSLFLTIFFCCINIDCFPFTFISFHRRRLLRYLTRLVLALLGDRIVALFHKIVHYVTKEKNPILSIFNFALVLGVYFTYIFKVIPSAAADAELILLHETCGV